jgi:hypothetical protein
MILCLKCKSSKTLLVTRDIIEPARDLFQCQDCLNMQYRYEGTIYEKEGDLKYENRTRNSSEESS